MCCNPWSHKESVTTERLNWTGSKEIKLANPKGNQLWKFIGRADAEAPILWPPDVNSRLIGKGPDAGKDRGQEEKGTTEDERVGWRHRLDGHEFEQILGDGKGQGSLECCSPWGHRESDMTEQLNNSSSPENSYPQASSLNPPYPGGTENSGWNFNLKWFRIGVSEEQGLVLSWGTQLPIQPGRISAQITFPDCQATFTKLSRKEDVIGEIYQKQHKTEMNPQMLQELKITGPE